MTINYCMKEWLRKQSLIKVLALVAICLIPVVYKELLDEFSLGRVISSALYVLPLCFLLASIRKKWIFIVFSSVLMVTSFLETMMVLLYKNYLIAGNILAILGTTADEGTGFVLSSLSKVPLALPVILVFVFLLLAYRPAVFCKRNILCAGLCALASVLFLTYQLNVRWQGNITTTFYVEQNVLARPPYNFWFQSMNAFEQQLHKRDIGKADKMSFGAKRPKVVGKEIYVLAIGESLRYDNLSLAGYYRSTTPLLDSLEPIVLFSNYYSTANLTMYSVPQIVTRATPEDFNLNYREKSIFKPFQECGFQTFVIGNNLMGEKGYEYLSHGCDKVYSIPGYDDSKIASLVDSLSNLYDKVFFIVHFKGNHGPYNNFKKAQNKFRPNPVFDHVGWDNHEAMVNAYDNTVLFMDYCVYHIIKAIDKKNAQSGFLMVPDHGADYDTGVSDHGGNCNPRKPEYHVPLILWQSEVWRNKYPKKYQSLKANKDKPVNADNVFYSVCDMADITIRPMYAKAEWSVFNQHLQSHERKLLVPDGKNYIVVK